MSFQTCAVGTHSRRSDNTVHCLYKQDEVEMLGKGAPCCRLVLPVQERTIGPGQKFLANVIKLRTKTGSGNFLATGPPRQATGPPSLVQG